MRNIGPMRKTMECINKFCEREYLNKADFTNLGEVGILYSTFGENEEHEIQINADLLDKELHFLVDGEEVGTDHYDSYESMAEDMEYLSFDAYYSAAIEAYEIRYPNWEEHDQIERAVSAAEAAEACRDWMREQGIFEMLNPDWEPPL